MKPQNFFATFLTLILFSFQSFAQINFQTSKSAENISTTPQYQIFEIGVVQAGDSSSQGLGVSASGAGFGRSFRTGGTQAFSWTNGGGIIGLPNLSGRAFCLSVGGDDVAGIVGTCSTTSFGSGRLPILWKNGLVSQLPLPAGQTIGDANDINASGVVVGSVNGGSQQRGVIYSNGTANVITQTTANGSFFLTAFKINNSGRVVGQGIDPTNAARNVGIVYDIGSSSAFEVGALPNANGALAFDISNTGFVVGSSMQNQGSGRPFIWSQASGMTEIPLPTGTSSGSARGVNSSGRAVGTASSTTAIPFLYDGTNTYRLGDLIPANSGWDLLNNTSSGALGISDDGVIIGTGILNGQARAFAMVPVNAANKTVFDFDGDGKTDASVFRNGTWYINPSLNPQSFYGIQFGLSTDKLAPADYDGDGKTDVAVWRESEGNFYILNSSNNSVRTENFGLAGDVLTVGDWDGDGKADLSTYREGTQSNFYYRGSLNNPSGNITYLPWGVTGDKAARGDFDGDGKLDAAVYRGSNQTWYIRNSSNGQITYTPFGLSSDKRISGDFDGDGKTDICVFRDGIWYILQSSDNQTVYHNWGLNSDTFVTGDYDGDGKTDVAVWRNGTYYILNSTSGGANYNNFGATGDKPVAAAFVQ